MEKITVMQNRKNNGADRYVRYLYKKVKEKFSFLSGECNVCSEKDSAEFVFEGEDGYGAHLRQFIVEHVADVLTIGYKYEYFYSNLSLPMLQEKDKFLFCSALVAADYADDKRYVQRRIENCSTVSLDGVYNFKLKELKERWSEILSFIPKDFGEYSLENFLDYVISDGSGKAYIKENTVYDENYRKIEKSELMGRKSLIAELLLSGAAGVYCFGKTDRETETFVKKYYKEKGVFC